MTPRLALSAPRRAPIRLGLADCLVLAALVAWFAYVGVAMLVAAGAP